LAADAEVRDGAGFGFGFSVEFGFVARVDEREDDDGVACEVEGAACCLSIISATARSFWPRCADNEANVETRVLSLLDPRAGVIGALCRGASSSASRFCCLRGETIDRGCDVDERLRHDCCD